jgi:hypothetical protein
MKYLEKRDTSQANGSVVLGRDRIIQSDLGEAGWKFQLSFF